MKIFTLLPIQPPIHRAEHDLEDTVTSQLCSLLPCERHGVHNVPQIVIASDVRKFIVQLLQMGFRLLIAADLEELHADLPGGRVELVELLGGLDEGAFDVVAGFAVGDADYVDGFRGFRGFGVFL